MQSDGLIHPLKTELTLTHYILEESIFDLLYAVGISKEEMTRLFANSGDPDQMPRSAASDLGIYYLPVTRLPVSRLQWVKISIASI